MTDKPLVYTPSLINRASFRWQRMPEQFLLDGDEADLVVLNSVEGAAFAELSAVN